MRPDLATVIVEARQAAGLSQAALARRAGISASYLSRIEGAAWERGGPLPADGVLRALARALGISSTALVALRRAAKGSDDAPSPLARANRRPPYAVSMGPDEVDAAACSMIGRNSSHGTLRSAQVFIGEEPADELGPSYLDTLGATLAASLDARLYRVCATDRRHMGMARAAVGRLNGGRSAREVANVRTRIAFCNPLVLDVLIGDQEVLLALPDRRGHPRLRAGIVVDDPDFVAAVRDWFDETVWDCPGRYADIRGEAVDEAFAGVDKCLSGAEDRTHQRVSAVAG